MKLIEILAFLEQALETYEDSGIGDELYDNVVEAVEQLRAIVHRAKS